MSLFDKEFYPTPKDVVMKMVAPCARNLATARILEPSAGNGAILDVLRNGVSYTDKTGRGYEYEVSTQAKKLYCIEKNPELRLILQQKGYRLLADDFLQFSPEHHFDLLIMNPPFSTADKHLLHAWEILHGGDIVCLLNAETIRNPYTARRRQLAAIIREHGSVEELGRCFAGSDHDTDVEVALVRLHKDKPANSEFAFDIPDLGQEIRPDFGELSATSDQVAVNDTLDAYLRTWQMTKICAAEFIRAFRKFAFYADTFLNNDVFYSKDDRGTSMYKLLFEDLLSNKTERGAENAYDNFIDNAKDKAWRQIIGQLGLEKYMTSAMEETMKQFRDAQGSAELSKPNIMALFQMLLGGIGGIMEKCVCSVFDLFTRYHSENTCVEEGWKTNKRYKVNQTVILPNVADAGFDPRRFGYSKKFSTAFSAYRTLEDIDKAMCWLSGTRFEDISGKTIQAVIQTIDVGDQNWYHSAFFDIKCFKKGTVHLRFRDEALWAKFNIAVNKGKNLIGEKE